MIGLQQHLQSPSTEQAHPPQEEWLPFNIGVVIEDPASKYALHLLAPLGQGSYAIVYKARDTISGRLFALKCLSKAALTTEQLHIQMNEVHIHRSLPKNLRIVTFHDYFETDDWLFLLLEYVNGRDLYWFITQSHDQFDDSGRRLSERERYELAVHIFVQCLDTVGTIHERHIAHRDLKPENFLIDRHRTVLLTDFGLATNEARCYDFDCGTQSVVLVECRNADAGDSYDPFQADIWSLGIILLNLLWHRSPWSDPCPDSCASFAAFQQEGAEFFLDRFDRMPMRMARFLAKRVFCPAGDRRIKIKEWKKWCGILVDMLVDPDADNVMDDEWTAEPPVTSAKKARFSLGPLTLTLSGRARKLSATSKKEKKEEKKAQAPAPPTPPKSPANTAVYPSEAAARCAPPSAWELLRSSWSDDIDSPMATGMMDFSSPVAFHDQPDVPSTSGDEGSETHAPYQAQPQLPHTPSSSLPNPSSMAAIEEEHKLEPVRSDADSGFATDDGERIEDRRVPRPYQSTPSLLLSKHFKATPSHLVPPPPPVHSQQYPSHLVSPTNPRRQRSALGLRFGQKRLHVVTGKRAIPYTQHQTWLSLEDAHSASRGTYVVGVGAYAYGRRPFAPPPPWRNWIDRTNHHQQLHHHHHQHNLYHQHLHAGHGPSANAPQDSRPTHAQRAPQQAQKPAPRNRRRSSTVSSSATSSSITIFNGPMLGMTVRSNSSCSTATQRPRRRNSARTPGKSSFSPPAKQHGFGAEKMGVTPEYAPSEDQIEAIPPPAPTVPGEPPGAGPWRRPGTEHSPPPPPPESEEWAQCDTGGSAPTPVKGVDTILENAEPPLDDSGESADVAQGAGAEGGEDRKPPRVGRSTMQQLGSLLRGIVGYNRQIKVGGLQNAA
ncbi:uncharacterized protein VTP21DRAFT_6862 [Calcarisporiella thermophila]|uniref:uncharacterized protein n=1 Tax=Calcarisporiella thermophila TaxID=911321 RepID=UPI0037444C22